MTTFDNPAALLEGSGELGTSDGLTIDQTRINGFADTADDHQWIHIDPDQARSGPFGTAIAHGYLTLTLAPWMLAQVVTVGGPHIAVNYGLNKVRFSAPVPVDSRVRGHVSLGSATPRGPSVEAVFSRVVEIDGPDRPACVAELAVLYT
jgi:acyl dehydratase